MRKARALAILSFIVLANVSLAGLGWPAEEMDFNSKMLIQQYILSYVRNDYVDSVGIGDLMDGAIQGMIEKLDPHSSYMPPQTADDFAERIQGGFAGIGITFMMLNNKITVIDVVEGGPSEKAGLKSRDKIVRINREDAKGFSQDKIRERLRGDAGTKVEVEIERPGMGKPFDTVITRDWVEMNSVSHSYLLDGTTGYIALTRFSIKTKNDVEKALFDLKAKGMERLVLDLRNNSGGVLDAAVSVVNLFLPEGTIVYTQGRKKSNNYTWKASGKALYPDLPLIVMMNHGSASASEIVAGALQDHDRALIVGQTSFGKGLVMNPIRLRAPDKPDQKNISLGTLMLSVSRYYTPSGRLIQRPYTGNREDYIREGFDDVDPNAADSSKTGLPVYQTDLGRSVYGGGGITPDIALTPLKRLNALERAVRGTNHCFEFADEYLLRHKDMPSKFESFYAQYRIPENEMKQFEAFIRQRGIYPDSLSSFDQELQKLVKKYDIPAASLGKIESILKNDGVHPDANLFARSVPFLEREIKQEIARMIWGTEERYRMWHRDDTELDSAVACFDQARELLAQRLAMKKE
ncbi:MAG: S41 family peptidase [Candidatus Latescibacterota bacterium]